MFKIVVNWIAQINSGVVWCLLIFSMASVSAFKAYLLQISKSVVLFDPSDLCPEVNEAAKY